MQVSAYYQMRKCPSLEKFGETLKKDSRHSVFGKVVREACDLLAGGSSFKEVLLQTYDRLKEGYASVEGFYDWQAEVYAMDDVRKLRRFFVAIGKAKILRANVPCTYLAKEGGDLDFKTLEVKASLVFEMGDKVYFAVIRPGKCDRSPGGKSLETQVSGDLRLLVGKWYLEKLYPGIVPWCVYLTHPDDRDENVLPDFTSEPTKATNLTVLPIGKYAKEGKFSFDALEADILAAAAVTPEKNCDSCEYASLCKVGEQTSRAGVVNVSAKKEEKPFVLPKFTPSQQQVVNHKDGPLLVCAGAGSGKTAALVGRIAKLVESGVSPNTILCLTFGTKAADELAKRSAQLFDAKGRPPKITTIHALAFDMLSGYGKEVFGKAPRVLDELVSQNIVEGLLDNRARIPGFKYEVKYGKYGLLNTVINRVEELRQLGWDGFKTKHGDIGDAFYDLATDYATAIELGQFISFDDMATQATALLKSNPEILDMYQFSYQYIMIDEFQDVSKDQAEFVYLLASGHHNLVAVGDDDQSIYRWRGACPSYMLDFPKQFNAPTVVFRDNFRSTTAIVNASQKVIRKNAERIDKDVVSSSGRDGDAPKVVHSTSPKDFQRVIGEMLDAGYHYGDIAIIARTNKTLKTLKDALECPCQIARTFLRHDGFFNFVKAAMDLYADPDDAMAFSLFCAPFGLQDSVAVLCATGRQLELARETKEFEGVMAILDELFEAIRQVMAPKDFIAKAKKLVFWDKSDAPSVLLDEFRLQFPEGGDLGDLREYCRKVVEYLSEKRVNETPTDSVTLITNHDCKGLEYPVVLLHSDYSSDSAEERSLFYVALTRAREKCVIFESKSAKVSFTADLLENNA